MWREKRGSQDLLGVWPVEGSKRGTMVLAAAFASPSRTCREREVFDVGFCNRSGGVDSSQLRCNFYVIPAMLPEPGSSALARSSRRT